MYLSYIKKVPKLTKDQIKTKRKIQVKTRPQAGGAFTLGSSLDGWVEASSSTLTSLDWFQEENCWQHSNSA